MRLLSYLRNIAAFISLLIISIPFIHAYEYNLIYDSNGNLVTGDGFYREYDDLNQLARIREGNLSTGKVLEEYIWHPIEEKIVIKGVFFNNTLRTWFQPNGINIHVRYLSPAQNLEQYSSNVTKRCMIL